MKSYPVMVKKDCKSERNRLKMQVLVSIMERGFTQSVMELKVVQPLHTHIWQSA